MKVIRVAQKTSTYQLHWEEHRRSSTCSAKNTSFDPDPVTPSSTGQSHLRSVCRWLTYSSSDDIENSEDEAPSPSSSQWITSHRLNPWPPNSRTTLDAQVYLEEDEEEDFQTVPLDDEHWTTEEVSDRTLFIHKHTLPHGLCPYPCPYANYLLPSYTGTMDLSDILDFEYIMITSSDEDIPALEGPPYWKNCGLHWSLYIFVINYSIYIHCLINFYLLKYICIKTIFNQLICMILTWRCTEIENFNKEHGEFPLVIVWVWQWGAWKHAPI